MDMSVSEVYWRFIHDLLICTYNCWRDPRSFNENKNKLMMECFNFDSPKSIDLDLRDALINLFSGFTLGKFFKFANGKRQVFLDFVSNDDKKVKKSLEIMKKNPEQYFDKENFDRALQDLFTKQGQELRSTLLKMQLSKLDQQQASFFDQYPDKNPLLRNELNEVLQQKLKYFNSTLEDVLKPNYDREWYTRLGFAWNAKNQQPIPKGYGSLQNTIVTLRAWMLNVAYKCPDKSEEKSVNNIMDFPTIDDDENLEMNYVNGKPTFNINKSSIVQNFKQSFSDAEVVKVVGNVLQVVNLLDKSATEAINQQLGSESFDCEPVKLPVEENKTEQNHQENKTIGDTSERIAEKSAQYGEEHNEEQPGRDNNKLITQEPKIDNFKSGTVGKNEEGEDEDDENEHEHDENEYGEDDDSYEDNNERNNEKNKQVVTYNNNNNNNGLGTNFNNSDNLISNSDDTLNKVVSNSNQNFDMFNNSNKNITYQSSGNSTGQNFRLNNGGSARINNNNLTNPERSFFNSNKQSSQVNNMTNNRVMTGTLTPLNSTTSPYSYTPTSGVIESTSKTSSKKQSINELVNQQKNNGNGGINNKQQTNNVSNNNRSNNSQVVEKPVYAKSIGSGVVSFAGGTLFALSKAGVIEVGSAEYVFLALLALGAVCAIGFAISDNKQYKQKLQNLENINKNNNRGTQRR